MHAGRSVQRGRDIPRGGHNGADHPNSRGPSDIRHGRFVVAADLAIQPAVRQADRRLATSTHLPVFHSRPTLNPGLRHVHACSNNYTIYVLSIFVRFVLNTAGVD